VKKKIGKKKSKNSKKIVAKKEEVQS